MIFCGLHDLLEVVLFPQFSTFFLLKIFYFYFVLVCYSYCIKLTPIVASTVNEEIVLGLIVERKRADDLASSIVDGRFLEQKVSESTYAINSSFLAVVFALILISL